MARGALNHPAKKMFLVMLGQEDVTSTLEPTDLVWVQGIIRRVDDEASTFILDDATATTKVDFSSTRKLRSQGDNLISVSSCVMVIGKLESCAPDSLIKAIKISPIPNCEVQVAMWELEVEDQHREVLIKRREERYKKFGDPMAHYPMGY